MNSSCGPAGMTRSTFKPLVAMTTPFSQGHQGPPPGQPAAVVRPFTENTAQWGAGFLMSTATELAQFAQVVMANGKGASGTSGAGTCAQSSA